MIASARASHESRGFPKRSRARVMPSLNTAGAPMYQFAQIIDFPFLGDEFLRLLAAHFRKVHPGKKLELEDGAMNKRA